VSIKRSDKILCSSVQHQKTKSMPKKIRLVLHAANGDILHMSFLERLVHWVMLRVSCQLQVLSCTTAKVIGTLLNFE
jgi:hypothetical protein